MSLISQKFLEPKWHTDTQTHTLAKTIFSGSEGLKTKKKKKKIANNNLIVEWLKNFCEI